MKSKNKGRSINRREFFGLAWAASLFALFGQAGNALIKFFRPRIEEGAFGGKIVVGRLAEFPSGTVSHIQHGRLYISHIEGTGILAIWHRCTHLGCTVPWREEEKRFHCPCHSSIFNPNGEVVSGPAPRPLDIFPIEIIDDEVHVDTGSPISRNRFDPSQATQV